MQFSRTFQLSDSPKGWTLALTGSLIGNLQATKLPGLPQSQSSVGADVTMTATPLHLPWNITDMGVLGGVPTVNPITINQLQQQTAVLGDGAYTLTYFSRWKSGHKLFEFLYRWSPSEPHGDRRARALVAGSSHALSARMVFLPMLSSLPWHEGHYRET